MAKAKKTVAPTSIKTTPTKVTEVKDIKETPIAEDAKPAATKKVEEVKKGSKKSEKKQLKREIKLTLSKTFTNIKKVVGEKKFNKHVKKATRAMAGGVIKKTKKAPIEKIPAAGKK